MQLEPPEPVTGVVRILPDEERRVSAEPATIEEAVEQLLHERRAPNLVFQPIVDLQRGATVGYEALSRFPGPPKQGPDRWFAAALAMGRGVELEALVLERALAARNELPDDCFLSVNVAPEALLDRRVQMLLSARPLSRVVFELTEHSAVADYDLLARAIFKVREWGGFVAVDDAGAGYASLQHILVLRPNFVKLDRALIAGLDRDEAKGALIEMFGGFTSRIDAWLLAEGIEERDELRRLIHLGVALGQGYYLGRPDPVMRPLSSELSTDIRATARDPSQRVQVGSLSEMVVSAHADSDDPTLGRTFCERPTLHALPLLDASGRPTALALRDGTDGVRRRPLMCVLESTPAEDALQRALTRYEANRFEPLACCDELGKYRGMLRIERLIEAALRSRD